MVNFFFNSCLNGTFVVWRCTCQLKALMKLTLVSLCRFECWVLTCTSDKNFLIQIRIRATLNRKVQTLKKFRRRWRVTRTKGFLCWCHRRPCRVHQDPIMCEWQQPSSTGFRKEMHDQSHDQPDGCLWMLNAVFVACLPNSEHDMSQFGQ